MPLTVLRTNPDCVIGGGIIDGPLGGMSRVTFFLSVIRTDRSLTIDRSLNSVPALRAAVAPNLSNRN